MQWQNEKGKAYGPQETEQKTYIWEVRAPQQSVVNSGAPEEQAVSTPLVIPAMFIMLSIRSYSAINHNGGKKVAIVWSVTARQVMVST